MQDKETGRLEAFSDGVFAVAITLLVLNIRLPPDNLLDDPNLWHELLGQWPMLAAFVTSFATIGIMCFKSQLMVFCNLISLTC